MTSWPLSKTWQKRVTRHSFNTSSLYTAFKSWKTNGKCRKVKAPLIQQDFAPKKGEEPLKGVLSQKIILSKWKKCKLKIENWDGLEQVLARPIFDILSTPFAHNLQVLFYKSVQRNCLQSEFFNYKKFSDCYHSIYDSHNFGPQKSIWQWTKRSMAHLFFHAPCIFDKVLPLDWLLGFSV